GARAATVRRRSACWCDRRPTRWPGSGWCSRGGRRGTHAFQKRTSSLRMKGHSPRAASQPFFAFSRRPPPSRTAPRHSFPPPRPPPRRAVAHRPLSHTQRRPARARLAEVAPVPDRHARSREPDVLAARHPAVVDHLDVADVHERPRPTHLRRKVDVLAAEAVL